MKTALAGTATAVYNLLDAVMQLEACHEYGHAENPFNELSDTLCTLFLEGCINHVRERTPNITFTCLNITEGAFHLNMQ